MKTIPSFNNITGSISNLGTNGIGQPTRLGYHIKLLTIILGLLAATAFAARASDPVGIYAIVDKVVFEPTDAAPERAQVWGAFAIAKGRGEAYEPAERGYMYFKLGPEPEVTRKEWADLKSVAGSGQIVGLGFRHSPKGTVRKADAKPENPDAHPKGMGLTKVKARDYPPLNELTALHKTKSPAK
jgi:hypothetical protein